MPPVAVGHVAVSGVMPMGVFCCVVDKIMIVTGNLYIVIITVWPSCEQGRWIVVQRPLWPVGVTRCGFLIILPPSVSYTPCPVIAADDDSVSTFV